ncbi:MAG: hypothetical protein R3C59_25780 [Planctomycetaceae bacterium]
MKVEDCIVVVERRTAGGCIDLAFVFARQFAAPLLKLTAWFAVPSVLLSWLVADSRGRDVLLPSLVIFGLFCMLASAAIVTAIGPQVFGVPVTTKAALRLLFSRLPAYVMAGTLARTTGLCLMVPLLFVMAWCGHLPEVLFLERTPLNEVSRRLSTLCRHGGYARNLNRLLTLTVFWAVFSFGVFLILDLSSGTLFQRPIFFGTIAPGPDMRSAFASQLVDDAVVVTALQVSLWLTFPVMRLAWFFCYLDQRIRNECWDLELQFRIEAVRLEEQLT